MSLVPLLFSNWWEQLERPHRLLDQNFGLALSPEQLQSPSRVEAYVLPRRKASYYRPWGELLRTNEEGTSTVQADKDKFQVVLDVQQFEPNEIDVKVVDNCVVVTAKHEEKRDEHGWVSRQFVRKYMIPEQCDIDQVTSRLSSDGVLSIAVPRKDQPKVENERVIKIERTGKPALQMKLGGKQQQQEQQQQQLQNEEKEEKE